MTEKDYSDLQKCKHDIIVAVQRLYDLAYDLGCYDADIRISSVESWKIDECIPRQIATIEVELKTKL